MRTRDVCTSCLQPVASYGVLLHHVHPFDAFDCVGSRSGLPIRATSLRVCDVSICDRLADVVEHGQAHCSGHAFARLFVDSHPAGRRI